MQTTNNGKPSELVRGLGLWACTAVIIGSMIGQGIFLVSSQVAGDVGSVGRALAAWLIGGAIVLLALCHGARGSSWPHAVCWGFLSSRVIRGALKMPFKYVL